MSFLFFFHPHSSPFSPQPVPKEEQWDYQENLTPPLEYLTDENLSLYFSEIWVDHRPGRAQIENAKRYINHVLGEHGLVTLARRGARSAYPKTITTLNGIKKEPRWCEGSRQGAKPLDKKEVKMIMNAPIKTLEDLIQKCICTCYLHMGMHKIDIYRIKESMVTDMPDYRHRDGKLKPKITITGRHNKRPNIKVSNVVSCGCQGSHNPQNAACEYSIWKMYMMKKKADDTWNIKNNFSRMNNKKKKVHFVDGKDGPGGTLKDINFFRTLNKKKDRFLHQNMGSNKIGDSLDYWNKKLMLRPNEKITSDMARKTFCTLGEKFFKFDRNLLRSISHHITDENFEIYVCPEYRDLEEEAHVSVTMQNWAQGKYQPPVHVTPSVMLSELNKKMESIQKMTIQMSKILLRQQKYLQARNMVK